MLRAIAPHSPSAAGQTANGASIETDQGLLTAPSSRGPGAAAARLEENDVRVAAQDWLRTHLACLEYWRDRVAEETLDLGLAETLDDQARRLRKILS